MGWIWIHPCVRTLSVKLNHHSIDQYSRIYAYTAVERQWIGENAWDACVKVQVALGVNSADVVNFVKDRMTR